MKRILKHFEELTLKELYELLRLRSEIFVVEQDCPYQDLDGLDYEGLHLFYEEEDGTVIACLRIFQHPDDDADTVRIGRVVTKEHGKGLGALLLHEGVMTAETYYCPHRILLEAQEYAKGFYEKEGFTVVSDMFLEDGIPHVRMEKICQY